MFQRLIPLQQRMQRRNRESLHLQQLSLALQGLLCYHRFLFLLHPCQRLQIQSQMYQRLQQSLQRHQVHHQLHHILQQQPLLCLSRQLLLLHSQLHLS